MKKTILFVALVIGMIATAYGQSFDGIKIEDIKPEYNNEIPVAIPKTQVISAIDKCCRDKDICVENILNNPVPYEDPENSTQVSIDDVNVKKQEEFRPGGRKPERGKRKYIHNTIAHISKEAF